MRVSERNAHRRNRITAGRTIGGLTLAALIFAASSAVGQVDSDDDLNADIADPFPFDPTQGGVYVGGTIDYDVLMTGDLDATGFTGTVLTITGDGLTFDGNGQQMIAPDAQKGFRIATADGFTLKTRLGRLVLSIQSYSGLVLTRIRMLQTLRLGVAETV